MKQNQTDKFNEQQKKINEFFKNKKQEAVDLQELYNEFNPGYTLINGYQIKDFLDQTLGKKALKKDLTFKQAYLIAKFYNKYIINNKSEFYIFTRNDIAMRWKAKGHKKCGKQSS